MVVPEIGMGSVTVVDGLRTKLVLEEADAEDLVEVDEGPGDPEPSILKLGLAFPEFPKTGKFRRK